MEMWEEYQKEKYGRKTLRTDKGFICYSSYDDGSLYIDFLFVKPEFRLHGEGKRLEDMVIEKEQPNSILCEVDLNSQDCEKSLAALIRRADYKILKAESDRIILYKKVSNA